MSRGGVEGLDGATPAQAIGRLATVVHDQRMRLARGQLSAELAQIRGSLDRLVESVDKLEVLVTVQEARL